MSSKPVYMDGQGQQAVVAALRGVLADTFVLYMKTHACHWNVEGPNFKSLHDLFEEQYTDMWEALDEIAERLRALGAYAPTSAKDLTADARLKELDGAQLKADAMLEQLANDNLALAKTLGESIEIAEKAGDEATIDLFVERTQIHEKAAWMLNSSR